MIDTRLSDKEYLLTLFKAMRSTFSTGQEPSAIPTAAILISQTGAGKTSLREAINPNGQEYVVINPDLYKNIGLMQMKLEQKIEPILVL